MENTEGIKISDTEKIKIFGKLYNSLSNGMKNGNAVIPKQWLSDRKLTAERTGACFNSGQVHHRKEQAFKDGLLSIGFIKRCNVPTNNGQIPYTIFGKYAICFPLRNEKNEVINFYAIGIEKTETAYLNEEGIYPNYPEQNTKRLYIVPSILETATILEIQMLNENESVMALYDGAFKTQHYTAIEKLKELEEIILVDRKE
jgi:hypothetical protein